jgi:PAS domain S-box-containing protein
MRAGSASEARDETLRGLPPPAQLYVIGVIAAGAAVLAASFPPSVPSPALFAALLVVSCLTSLWKVRLLLAPKSGATLSVSYAADLMALLLLGGEAATLVAVVGAWAQCTFKVERRYPAHRTIFSMAAEAITMQATAATYVWLGGVTQPLALSSLPRPLVGAIAAYFLANTLLVGIAISLATRSPLWKLWHDNFLWSAPSFMVAGSAGALAAVVVQRGEYWVSILLLAPVYLAYRTYGVFLGRIQDQQLHVEHACQLHAEAVEALACARRAERALAEETERLSVTLRSIADAVITTDMDGRVQLLNPAAEQLTGWTHADACGGPVARIYRSVEPTTRTPRDVMAEFRRRPAGPGLRRHALLLAGDTSERPIEETAAPLSDAAGRTLGMVLVFRDISDAIRMQTERARADKLASLGLLAGGIAHDFNDILMAIMGNISLARLEQPHRAVGDALTAAEQACVRARQLTWRLLTFSKGGVPVKTTLALPRLLDESVRLALTGAATRHTVDVDDALWAVEADETQLIQVFNNMLTNAQQAMPHGGTVTITAENVVERSARCEHALQVPPGRYVRIAIRDHGIGIPPENLGSIFDPYFTTKQSGSGLGLATSYSIVKNHGGFLTVDSTLGRGTTMNVYLPAAMDGEMDEPLAFSERGTGATGRILVMDDERSIRALAASMLEHLGYHVEAVGSGAAAIECYRRALADGRPFDAVILDLVVPEGMGGKEAMDRLGQIDEHVTAILASGYAEASMTEELQGLGFRAIIPKPYTIDELSRTLGAVIAPRASRVH